MKFNDKFSQITVYYFEVGNVDFLLYVIDVLLLLLEALKSYSILCRIILYCIIL